MVCRGGSRVGYTTAFPWGPVRGSRARTAGTEEGQPVAVGAGLPAEWAGEVESVSAVHAAAALDQVSVQYRRRRIVAPVPAPGEWDRTFVPGAPGVAAEVQCDRVGVRWREGEMDVSWTAVSVDGREDGNYGG